MLYTMSDIHGNVRNFDAIMEQINFGANDRLMVLGDVIDRHPHGLYLLQKLMKMNNVDMILGNHEYMMMRAMGIKYRGVDISYGDSIEHMESHWFQNGGTITKYEWEYDLTHAQRIEVTDFLSNLDVQKNVSYTVAPNDIRPIIFCHAAPLETYDPELYYRNNNIEFAVWDRDAYLNPVDLGATVIFGHTPVIKSYFPGIKEECRIAKLNNNWIAIDCGSGWGAGSGGRLSCLRIDDMKEFYSD